MKKKYFCEEDVFAFVCSNADRDGIWSGDGTTLASEFRVSEDEAHATLSDLCDRGLIEKVLQGRYAVVEWRERNDYDEQDQ